MGNIPFCRADRAEWLAQGPFAAHLDAYRQHLIDGGYAAGTTARYLAGLAHLSQWMRRRRIRMERISEALVAEFLDDHLPSCRCQAPVLRRRSEVSSALGHLLVVLRNYRAIAPPAVSTTPVDLELRRYGQYMTAVRGLAPKTRGIALRIVGRLLRSRFGDGPIDIAAITPAHVRRLPARGRAADAGHHGRGHRRLPAPGTPQDGPSCCVRAPPGAPRTVGRSGPGTQDDPAGLCPGRAPTRQSITTWSASSRRAPGPIGARSLPIMVFVLLCL
jgi:hypothetical protein